MVGLSSDGGLGTGPLNGERLIILVLFAVRAALMSVVRGLMGI